QEDVTYESLQQLHAEMLAAAQKLDFERAQALRDQIVRLEAELHKRLGPAAPPSVFGNKKVPTALPTPAGRGRAARTRRRRS
ncbi:MAG: UvrB/UvrC motif-containing protein, partial [Gemmataceae bacterium]|nr:UvrB/UvrC motif-containing protein [Gemmataceae bacterium]